MLGSEMKRSLSFCASALLLVTAVLARGRDSGTGWGGMVGNPELDEWIAAAILEAPSLDLSRASLRVAAAGERSARSERQPSLSSDIDLRAGRRRNAMTEGQTADLEPVSVGLSAAWELDVFGRIRATVGAARFARESGSFALRDREIAFAAEIAHSYLEGRRRVEELVLIRKTLVALDAIAGYHNARVVAGLERSELRDQAEANRLLAKREVAAGREALALLEARWKYLAPDDTVPDIASFTNALPEDLPKVPGVVDLHTLVLNRPDVQATRAIWLGARQRTKASERNNRPTLEMLAEAKGDGPSPIEEPEEWIAWAGIRLSLPVLAPGKRTEIEIRRMEEEGDAALYEETVRLALMDIRKAFVARIHAEEQWLAAKQEVEKTGAKLDSVTRQFQQGLVSMLTQETARLNWIDAEERCITAHALVLQRHVALLRACGGPFPGN